MRKNKLGSGSNGDIYSICMQSDMNKKMAMKEVGMLCQIYHLIFPLQHQLVVFLEISTIVLIIILFTHKIYFFSRPGMLFLERK